MTVTNPEIERDDSNTTHDAETTATKVVERTPLPKLQVFIVFLIQFAEPVTATVIYPFINEFVRETGITQGDETKTGYYAGIIESVFFIAETMTVFLWGLSSDIFGRKPILLLGPLGLSLAMLGFGLSKTFWSLVYYRCLQGFFNGNIGVSKSILAEITDKTNIGDAYALIPLMWNSGVTIGPIIGGILTRPAERWPDTLGKISLLREYPYLLPCLVASIIAFTSFAISAVALKETLPSAKKTPLLTRLKRLLNIESEKDESKRPLLSTGTPTEYGAIAADAETGSVPANVPAKTDGRPKLGELFVPGFISVLINYGILSFVDMANAALIPLIWSTPITYGGLGLDPYRIGTIMAAEGLTSGFLQVMFMGSAMRRFGPRRIHRVCFVTFLVSFCCFPFANAFARQAGYVDWKVMCVIAVQFASLCFVSPCYAAMSVLVVQSTPNPGLLGSANGVAQMVTSGMRSFAPAVASSLFAVSIARNLVGGCMVYVVLVLMVLAGMRVTRSLPNPSP
ncbi:major facilitator superfamily transporter [Coprinopsis cinerea AmutBmut pab1-1]|nr:major facilitator superfamily transporter [Coprinopsis cinerea AmutBmut pab1-1]